MKNEFIKLTSMLCNFDAPSSKEDEVRNHVQWLADKYADAVETDTMGNVLVFRKGKKSLEKPVMIAAHMDEVGVIIKRISDDGTLKFGFVGGVDPRVVLGKRVRFGGVHGVKGVVGIKAVHLTTIAERKKMPKTEDLYIDIGASAREQAEKLVSLGMVGTFDTKESSEFGDGLLCAKALDDRVGCAVLLTLLREEPPVDTWFVFTVQEEVGLRGAATAAFRLQPNYCLVVEGTTAADVEGVPEAQQVCRMRGGVVIPFMDRGTIYDRELFDLLRNAADKNNIPWQTKRMVAGGTDAGRIHRIGTGARVAGIAAPIRYIHSPVSVAAISDMEALLALARAFLEEMYEKSL